MRSIETPNDGPTRILYMGHSDIPIETRVNAPTPDTQANLKGFFGGLGDSFKDEIATKNSFVSWLRNVVVKPEADERLAKMIVFLSSAIQYSASQLLNKSVSVKVVISTDHDLVVEHTLDRIVDRLPEAVKDRRDVASTEEVDRLIENFIAVNPVAGTMMEIEVDNANARLQFMETYPVLTSKQIADQANARTDNASSTATRWRSAKKIFGMPFRKGISFPAFQFRDGRPHPVIAAVLNSLPAEQGDWQTAFWFVTPNARLGRKRPIEMLDDQEALVQAARFVGQEIYG
jgi:hypothetical protein